MAAWGGRRAQKALEHVRARGDRESAPCCICGRPIDYSLRAPNEMSCSVQHVIPQSVDPLRIWDPMNWEPAHLRCNKEAGASLPPSPHRLVVALFGPPGAGKTTAARESGLEIFDRDDDKWASEHAFREALANVGANPFARAVVLRSGASSSARAKTMTACAATHAYLLVESRSVLAARVSARGRDDKAITLMAIGQWFDQFDRRDGVEDFPGWQAVLPGEFGEDGSDMWVADGW